jgi:transitional endoplasmic reticulum ATPase
MVAQFLTEMDGLTEAGGIVVVGATNRADRIDRALLRPGRFDLVLEMPAPDRAAREAMLRLHAGRMALAEDVDLAALAAALEGGVGADVAGLCRLAALAALARAGRQAEAASLTVSAADFSLALHQQRENVSWQNP